MEIKTLIEKKAEVLKLRRIARKYDVITKSDVVEIESEDDVLKRTIIGNTYNWLDNHGDVHLSGCFAKSISERTPFFLADHKHDVTAKVGIINEVMEAPISWAELGVDKEGNTECLKANVDVIEDLNKSVYYQYKNGMINQHSVGMEYIQLDIAINDTYDKEGYANWLKYLPMLGNPIEAEECGYFYLVKEAKLFEISAVLAGSNILTPTMQDDAVIKEIYNKFGDIEKFYEFCKITLGTEPTNVTQVVEPKKKSYYKHLIKK